jgi:LacI family kdg operon repressor
MEQRYLQLLTTYRVEGVIVNALGVNETMLQAFAQDGVPVVLVDRAVEGLVADMVGLDNAAAVALAVRHLAEQGFEELVFVVQPFEHVSSRRVRESAFRDTIGALGMRGSTVVFDLDHGARVGPALAGIDARIAEASACARRVVLFAANAPVALRVALHLKERYGENWQRQVALMCIDDSAWAELAGLSTVRQPTRAIGERAVRFLHERMEGARLLARECLLPGELVMRDSTRSLRNIDG